MTGMPRRAHSLPNVCRSPPAPAAGPHRGPIGSAASPVAQRDPDPVSSPPVDHDPAAPSLPAWIQEELGQLADDGSLEVALSVLVTVRQPQEIEDERRLDEVARPLDGLPLPSKLHHASLVPALEQTQVERGEDLALEVGR